MAQKNLFAHLSHVPMAQKKFVAAAMEAASVRAKKHAQISFWEEIAPAFSAIGQEDCYLQMEEEARAAGMWDLVHRARHMQNQARKAQRIVV